MEWYYGIQGQQSGPVGEAEFQQLVQQGVITPQTLVWRQGLANWLPYNQLGTSTAAPPPVPPGGATAVAGGVVCASCGRAVPEQDAFVLNGARYCAVCKPQVLQRIAEGKPLTQAAAAAEEMRKLHINHEASIRSIGLLYYLGGTAMLLGGVGMAIASFAAAQTSDRSVTAIVGVVLVPFAIGYFFVGSGLRRLRPWVRIPVGILSGLGLLSIPVGTIINGYILYLVFSQKGTTVFSAAYQDVIRQTPHIKYKTSIAVWIFLALVLVFLGVMVLVAMLKH
jgi:hypothetical protein